MSISMSESSFWILSALAGGKRHGYGILRDVDQLSNGTTVLKVPTLYAALDRLQHTGLIAAAGEDVVDGRARRYYELTNDGSIALQEEAARLQSRARIAAERLAAGPRAALASVAFA